MGESQDCNPVLARCKVCPLGRSLWGAGGLCVFAELSGVIISAKAFLDGFISFCVQRP